MSFHGLRPLAGIAAACAAATVLTAQQQPVFRAGVELVQIDAVAIDQDGNPVAGLTAADFSVFENGRRQTIADFRPVSIPTSSRTLDPKLPPVSFIENVEPLNRRLFVLVVDNLHIRPVDMPRTRQLLTALVQGFSPDDQMALATTGPSEASVDLTADPVLQARALAQLGQKAGTPLGFTGRPGQEVNFDILENVIESLARSRHARRVVVYVSPATPFELSWVDRRGTLRMLREGFSRTLDAARHANVVVYAIDPLGLDGVDIGSGQAGDLQQAFAQQSGGLGFGRWSDYRRVARRILEDNATFYVLSYHRDPAAARDTDPSIEVRPNTRGFLVRARKAFVAEAASGAGVGTITQALSDPLPLNGVRLRGSVMPGTATGGNRVAANVILEIIYSAPPGTTRITDQLEFGVLAIDYDARVLATRTRAVSVDVSSAGAETRHVIREAVDLPPGPAVVRLGVSSKALGRIGTVHVPVRIPHPIK